MCIGCTSPVPAFFRASFLLRYRIERYFPLPFFGVAPCDLPATFAPRKSPERRSPCRASFFAFRPCICVACPGRSRNDAHFPFDCPCVSALLRQPAFFVVYAVNQVSTFPQLLPCERLPAPFAAVFLSMPPQGSHTRAIRTLTPFQIDFSAFCFL